MLLGSSFLPLAIGRLTALEEIDLCGNALTDLPAFLTHLPNLHTIWVGANPLKNITLPWKEFPQLINLDMGCTVVPHLPEALAQLPKSVNLTIARALVNDPVVAVLDARGVFVDCFERADESEGAEDSEGGLDAHELRQVKEDPSGKEE